MIKNYIFYMGGTFGDITEKILNNGKALDEIEKNWVKQLGIIPNDIKNKIINCDLKNIAGHNSYILDWNFKNYCILVTNEKMLEICSKRFFFLEYSLATERTIKEYFSDKLVNKIESQETKSIFYKKMMIENFLHNKNFNNCIKLNYDNIYNKVLFLEMLGSYFSFDNKIANDIYDEWIIKEKKILSNLGKSFD